jgi:hypothetical protein
MEGLIPYDVILLLRNTIIWINLISDKLILTSQDIGKNRKPPHTHSARKIRRYFGNVVKGGTEVLPRPALQLGCPIVVISEN